MADMAAVEWVRHSVTRYGYTEVLTLISSLRSQKGAQKVCLHGERRFPKIRYGSWWLISNQCAARMSRTNPWSHRNPKSERRVSKKADDSQSPQPAFMAGIDDRFPALACRMPDPDLNLALWRTRSRSDSSTGMVCLHYVL